MFQRSAKFILGFVLLFLLYHSAEYMIVFKNSPAGFLGFQALFFVAAFFIAKWQFGKGFAAWGLDFRKGFLKHLLLGMLMGLVLYALTISISILFGVEKISSIPTLSQAALPLSLFVFGNFFSSFSEDILTRGYIYKHLHSSINNWLLILLSAAIYLLNHIYRLADGFETYSYLFALGILFVIPLIITKRLWFTGGMHWAGNCFFFATHEIIKTESLPNKLSPNYILAICIIAIIPLNYFLLKKLRLNKEPIAARFNVLQEGAMQ